MKILDSWKSEALVDKEQYENLYKESILENDDFWNKQGNRINWIKKYSKIMIEKSFHRNFFEQSFF